MKKIISLFTIVCLLLVTFVSFVYANYDVEIIKVTYTSQNDEFILTVKGTTAPGRNVSLTVKNQNSQLRALEQTRAASDGTFEYEIGVEITADKGLVADPSLPVVYTVYARDYNNKTTSYSVPLYSNSTKQAIVDLFNGTNDKTTMTGYIETYGEIFGFNMSDYAGNEDAVALNMIAAKNAEKFTLENISLGFDKAVTITLLFNGDSTSDKVAVIEHPLYGGILDFEKGFDGNASIYPEYKAMEASEKTQVNSVVFADANKKFDFAELKEEFFMAITAEKFAYNKEDYTAIYEFLKLYNGWFDLEELENLKNTEISKILTGILEEGIPDNKKDFAELYSKYYAEATKDDTPVNKPAAGGGGGGGGGSMITPPMGDVGYEPQPEAPQTGAVIVTDVSFKDLGGYEWATDAVTYLAEKGVVNGKAEGVFAPADNITREEFAKILVLAYGLYDVGTRCEFTDVEEGRWSYKYVACLYKYGVVQGYPDGSFGATNRISREDMAVMLYRVLLAKCEIDASNAETKNFNDSESISEYAANSVTMLSANGFISGDDMGNFNPKKVATRAEACQMIYNTIVKKGGNQ